jgi:hypothetical protein
MTTICDQWIRKLGLFVFSDKETIDLSDFHVKFDVANADVESPNNATIRIYNLAQNTVKKLTQNSEYKSVSLNAGYVNGNYGVVFQGQIKQYRVGKESATTTYLDILAADGDIAYNQGYINESLKKGVTPQETMTAAAQAMGIPIDYGSLKTELQYVPSIRGKVLFGMARAYMRNAASTLNANWSIQNGVVQVVDNKGYLDGETVVLNSDTGLIGIPEQTDEGIRMKCLLNSRIRIGGLIQIDNSTVNKTVYQNTNTAAVPYDRYSGLMPLAPLSDDGIYRVMVAEHEGDNRGTPWYTNLVCLAFDATKKETLAQ